MSGCGGNSYLWIDTLCCPVVESPAKTTSIRLLKETYQRAKYVLVLDAGLTSCGSKNLSPCEIAARIFTSTWLQRLWTLQEGALAEDRLWFQFEDKPIRLTTLMGELLNVLGSNIVYSPLVTDMVRYYNTISLISLVKQPVYLGHSKAVRLGILLCTLDKCLRHRSVTVPSDEALCIFNLLQLSTDEILNCEPTVEARMGKIWQLIAKEYGGIPQ